MSTGAEFFKGAPGGRGRPGNAGFKGVKGAVVILFMLNMVVQIMMDYWLMTQKELRLICPD